MTEEVPNWPANPVYRTGDKGRPQPIRSMLQLSTTQINRFIVCGSCPRSGIDPAVVRHFFAEGVKGMIHKIDVYREYGFDPEKSRANRLEYKKRYRVENKEYIEATREATRRDKRLTALKEEMNGRTDR